MSDNNQNSSDERLARLEQELQNLKNDSSNTNQRDIKKVYSAIKDLQSSIDSLSHVFSTVQKTILKEQQGGKSPDDKLDELLDQNEHIATAFMSMNNKIEQIEDKLHENQRQSDNTPKTTPRPNFNQSQSNTQNMNEQNNTNAQPSRQQYNQPNNDKQNMNQQNNNYSQNQNNMNQNQQRGFQKPPNNFNQNRQNLRPGQSPNAGLQQQKNSNSMPGTSNYYMNKENLSKSMDTPPKPKKELRELKRKNKGFLGGMFGK